LQENKKRPPESSLSTQGEFKLNITTEWRVGARVWRFSRGTPSKGDLKGEKTRSRRGGERGTSEKVRGTTACFWTAPKRGGAKTSFTHETKLLEKHSAGRVEGGI